MPRRRFWLTVDDVHLDPAARAALGDDRVGPRPREVPDLTPDSGAGWRTLDDDPDEEEEGS